MVLDLIPLTAPVILLLFAMIASLRPARRQLLIPKLAQGAALAALAVGP